MASEMGCGEVAAAIFQPRLIQRFGIAILLFLVGSTAAAVCPNTTETAEQALWNVHNCSPAFRTWFRDAFNLQESHWDGAWGWSQCNAMFAFPKMMNAAYLLTYGLEDTSLGPWHDNRDYYTWASGRRHEFRYEPEDATGAIASAFDGFWRTDRVEMRCPSFNSYSAGLRAGTQLHESTHVIYYRFPHKANNPGSSCTKACSDDWLFHALGAYPYGQLKGHKHSMTQIQTEFLCDLSEFPESWVPAMIASLAGSRSTNIMGNRVLNPPGWTCGLPRPLYVPLPSPRCPTGQKCCGFGPANVCHQCIPMHASCP